MWCQGIQPVGVDNHRRAAAGHKIPYSDSGLLPLPEPGPDSHGLLVAGTFQKLRYVPVHQKIATSAIAARFIETLAALFETHKDRFGKLCLHDRHDTSWGCECHQSRSAPQRRLGTEGGRSRHVLGACDNQGATLVTLFSLLVTLGEHLRNGFLYVRDIVNHFYGCCLKKFLEKLGPVKVWLFGVDGEGAQVMGRLGLVGALVEVPFQCYTFKTVQAKNFRRNGHRDTPAYQVPGHAGQLLYTGDFGEGFWGQLLTVLPACATCRQDKTAAGDFEVEVFRRILGVSQKNLHAGIFPAAAVVFTDFGPETVHGFFYHEFHLERSVYNGDLRLYGGQGDSLVGIP